MRVVVVLAVVASVTSCGDPPSESVTPTTVDSRLVLERFTRDGYQCYRLFDDESASEGDPIVESCPESEIAPNDVTFEATGSLDGGPEYLVVTVPEAAMLLEASGPFTRSGPWLAIEAIDTSGTYSVRFENLGGEFLCSILMPIHVECDLVRMLE